MTKKYRKPGDRKNFPLGLPQELYERLQDYVTNYNSEATKTDVILTGLETELDKRFAEIIAYERTQTVKRKEAPETTFTEMSAANTGRKKSEGPLETLAASHCPVNGPTLPEGGNKS